ncbi:hypothetical protein L1987_80610 [Smallanthus sonchifolius]|uniref:Uncharacterized protein n=1 Tax=Smallanthus sonchifolius TaxID=185202 RepID=A0ACB8YSE2_9ASTR|nr:hypothetical protein L1987_80610 [Smallanthus sonchifolius]
MSNSMAAVLDREFALELLLVMLLWLCIFLVLVKNGDREFSMEVICAKYASLVGDLITLQVLCNGLPLAYNHDLQVLCILSRFVAAEVTWSQVMQWCKFPRVME